MKPLNHEVETMQPLFVEFDSSRIRFVSMIFVSLRKPDGQIVAIEKVEKEELTKPTKLSLMVYQAGEYTLAYVSLLCDSHSVPSFISTLVRKQQSQTTTKSSPLRLIRLAWSKLSDVFLLSFRPTPTAL
jgi:hypothetical protein